MFEHITPESLKATALEPLTLWAKGEGSFANTLVSGAMYELWRWYTALNSLVPMFYIDETSGEWIDRKCSDYGITRRAGETDAELVARYYAFLRRRATSGNVYHYEQWAAEVPGIGSARVFPLWNGAGTVKVLLSGSDGQGVPPEIVAQTYDHIERERPIGVDLTVLSAEELTVDIVATAVLDINGDIADIVTRYKAAVAEYLKSAVFESYTLSHSRFIYLLLDTYGVSDALSLTLNAQSGSLAVGDNQIPVVGRIEVNGVAAD